MLLGSEDVGIVLDVSRLNMESKEQELKSMLPSKNEEICHNSFKSEGIDSKYISRLHVGKSGKQSVETIHAPYSNIYYYLLEDNKFYSKNGADNCNVMVMRIGVFADQEKSRLALMKGFSRRSSENFYKSSRHAPTMKTFFEACESGKPNCTIIWDRPDFQKESGYICMNYNCGIADPKEVEQLQKLKDADGKQMDYLLIESSAQPTKQAMSIKREAKQSMFFGEDIDVLKTWIDEVCSFEKNVQSEVKKASSYSFFMQTAANNAELLLKSKASSVCLQRDVDEDSEESENDETVEYSATEEEEDDEEDGDEDEEEEEENEEDADEEEEDEEEEKEHKDGDGERQKGKKEKKEKGEDDRAKKEDAEGVDQEVEDRKSCERANQREESQAGKEMHQVKEVIDLEMLGNTSKASAKAKGKKRVRQKEKLSKQQKKHDQDEEILQLKLKLAEIKRRRKEISD